MPNMINLKQNICATYCSFMLASACVFSSSAFAYEDLPFDVKEQRVQEVKTTEIPKTQYHIQSLDNWYMEHALKIDFNKNHKGYKFFMQAKDALFKGENEKAIELLKKSVALQNTNAMVLLGYLYCEGKVTPLNTKEGLELLDRAAFLYNFTAWGFLATELIKGNIADAEISFDDLLWLVIRNGILFEKSFSNALKKGQISADKYDLAEIELTIDSNLASAFRRLGKVYYFGEFAPLNLSRSVYAYQESLEYDPDNTEVLIHLAYVFYLGRGVNRDDAKALNYAKRAANLHHGEGYLILARIFADPSSRYHDYNNAKLAYTRACELNIKDACNALNSSSY